MKKCFIRRDLLDRGLSVPVGNSVLNTYAFFDYEWKEELFYIEIGDRLELAESIDFDFTD